MIENKILANVLSKRNLTTQKDEKFAQNLVTWADVIRKTFYEGGVDEIISTRRLVHIIEAFAIFKEKMKAHTIVTKIINSTIKSLATEVI